LSDSARAIGELVQDCREEGDFEEIEDRHPEDLLIRLVNKGWRKLRSKVAAIGVPVDNTPTTVAQLPTEPPEEGEAYLEIDYPVNAVGIYGVDVLTRNKWEPLKPGTFAERRDYVSRVQSSSSPHTWVIQSLPREGDPDDEDEDATVILAGKIQLYPLSTGGNNFKIWYLPAWKDRIDPDHVLYGHDLWFDWLVNDVIARVARRDDDSANTLADARAARAEAWEEIKRTAKNLNRAEPIRPRRRARQWF
jgi:hypothetical protein